MEIFVIIVIDSSQWHLSQRAQILNALGILDLPMLNVSRLIAILFLSNSQPAINMFKVNNKYTRTRREVCSKLAIKTPEQHHWRRSKIDASNMDELQ